MRFYQEITLIKTPEITPYFIWSKLYMQVHLAFVEQQNPDETVNFGVSFPRYRYIKNSGKQMAYLGTKLRVFAPTQEALESLNLVEWLKRLADYIHIKSIQSIPEQLQGYLLVSRYQPQNMERKTRRFMRRESKRLGETITFEKAKTTQNQRYAKANNITLNEAEKLYYHLERKDYPYIQMKSLSSGHSYSLFIKQEQVGLSHKGSFSTYGLSTTATVPHW